MPISQNIKRFCGKPVVDFNPDKGIGKQNCVYRLRIDRREDDQQWEDLWEAFISDPKVGQVEELVVGLWVHDLGVFDMEADVPVYHLTESKAKLPKLKALFLGDITYEECEISWIRQTNVGPLFKAFPRLELLRIRGGAGLSLGKPAHDKLKTLVIETGAMGKDLIKQLSKARFPALEHLELWLGSDQYGANVTPKSLARILSGELFPNLTYLGLCNSTIADKIAEAVAEAPILEQLEVLDLSKGLMTDAGAEALMRFPLVSRLKRLDLRHHFISPGVIRRMKAQKIRVDARDRQEPEVYDEGEGEPEVYRHIFVAE